MNDYNKLLRGHCAEYILRAQLAYMSTPTIRMPENNVYDILNGDNLCRIEVKSSKNKPHNSYTKSPRKCGGWSWIIKDTQLEKDACDYFVCIAFKDCNNPFYFDTYIVPSEAMIEFMKIKKKYTFSKRKDTKGSISLSGDKSAYQTIPDTLLLGYNKWDLLIEKDKTKFKRKKNALAKKMIKHFKNFYYIDNPEIKIMPIKELTPHQIKKGKRYKCKVCKHIPPTSRVNIQKHIKSKRHLRGGIKMDSDRINTKVFEKQILKLWNKGYTKLEIAKELKCLRQTITIVSKRLGLPRYNPNKTKQE